MEKLLEILNEIRPDVDFEKEKFLIDDGILDSFDVVSIISELNDAFDIAIRVTELGPENFNSTEAIFNMIKKLQTS
jgi:acyl carrier protein